MYLCHAGDHIQCMVNNHTTNGSLIHVGMNVRRSYLRVRLYECSFLCLPVEISLSVRLR